ncbi:MAG: hypothetical protein ACRELT_16000 [Longimicrobiales bacterium]
MQSRSRSAQRISPGYVRSLFDTQAEERLDIADGFSWRFPPDALNELAAFISLERYCCPFLRFRIEVHPDGGSVWLTIDGPPGTAEFLELELAIAGRTPAKT